MAIVTARAWAGLLVCAALAATLSGCGSQGSSAGSSTPAVPGYVTEPLTHQQQLVEQGAGLVVADGCAVCHLANTSPRLAPSFTSLAGHPVTLRDGQRVLVDERFLREALLRPQRTEIRGTTRRRCSLPCVVCISKASRRR